MSSAEVLTELTAALPSEALIVDRDVTRSLAMTTLNGPRLANPWH